MDTPSSVLQSLDFRLSYGDCDPAGIVYYAAYYPWMERTYNEWTHSNEYPPSEMRHMWGATHISRASGCEYLVPAKLFDPIRSEMRLVKLGRTSFTMVFDMVHRERGELLARGNIVFVFIDDDLRPIPIPEGFRQVLRLQGIEA